MLIDILMALAALLVAICGLVTYLQFRKDYSNDLEKVVADSMAARSNKVLLDLADAYQMPDEIGMDKVREIERCKAALFKYESDYFVTLEELECKTSKPDNVTFLSARS